MFGPFRRRKKSEDDDLRRYRDYIPPEFRRTRTGPFGLFKRKIDDESAYQRNAPEIPSEFRRSPAYNRLPEWCALQVAAIGRFLSHLPTALVRMFHIRFAGWFICMMAFLGGVLSGAFVMRQRANFDPITARIRGSAITARQFHHRLEMVAGPEAMNTMIAERLLMQFARTKHAIPTDSEVTDRVHQVMTRPDYAETLRQKRLTTQEIRDAARIALAQEHLVGSVAQVSDAEIAAYYNHQISPQNPEARFYTPESVGLSVIVSRAEGDIRNAMSALQQGMTFERAARAFSTDASAFAGGVVPTVFRGRSAISGIPGFEETAFTLRPGETAQPRKFGDNWYILHCRERTAAAVRPLETVREQCRQEIQMQKSAKIAGPQIARDYTDFRARTNIQIFWDTWLNGLKSQVVH